VVEYWRRVIVVVAAWYVGVAFVWAWEKMREVLAWGRVARYM